MEECKRRTSGSSRGEEIAWMLNRNASHDCLMARRRVIVSDGVVDGVVEQVEILQLLLMMRVLEHQHALRHDARAATNSQVDVAYLFENYKLSLSETVL